MSVVEKSEYMRLKLLEPYKSLTFLPPLSLPSFSVLTGLNGSGKTHFLEAIKLGKIEVEGMPISQDMPLIAYFDWNSLVPKDVKPTDPQQLVKRRNDLWAKLGPAIDSNLKSIQKRLLGNGVPIENCANPRELILASDEDFERLVPDATLRTKVKEILASRLTRANANILGAVQGTNDSSIKRTLDRLSEEVGQPLVALNSETFHTKVKLGQSEATVFQQSFGTLFTGYYHTYCQNQLAQFRVSKGDTSLTCLSDEEFVVRNGPPPWDVVNAVLENSALPFRVTQPTGHGDQVFQPLLHHLRTSDLIKFEDLSSGEKVLMSLALCLYHASDAREFSRFPRLLLFDEVDAPLHPSMTTSLLRTINDTLVRDLKIDVILATHSPSTVALSSDESLYLVILNGDRILKTTKDKALAALTEGVPTLSINFDNRRQVFVESSNDAYFYEVIFRKLQPRLSSEISLNFLSSGGLIDGDCNQVKEIVNRLSAYGNKTTFGIIDWDGANGGNPFVKVLGKDHRYSIDNYLFDPLSIAALLLRMKNSTFDRVFFGLPPDATFVTFPECSTAIQSVANQIVELAKMAYQRNEPEAILDEHLVDCAYGTRIKLTLPNWYLRLPGEKLFAALLGNIAPLRVFKTKNDLGREVVKTIVDDVPELISVDFVEVFSSIQEPVER